MINKRKCLFFFTSGNNFGMELLCAACFPVIHSILLHSGALVYSGALKSCCFGLGAESLFCSFDICERRQDAHVWFDRWIFFTVESINLFLFFFLTVCLLLYLSLDLKLE